MAMKLNTYFQNQQLMCVLYVLNILIHIIVGIDICTMFLKSVNYYFPFVEHQIKENSLYFNDIM